MSIINTRKFNHAAKKFNKSNKIASILTGQKEQSKILKESQAIVEEANYEENISKSFNTGKLARKQANRERQTFIANESKRLRGKLSFSIIDKSLPLDNRIKEMNADFITKQSHALSANLMKGEPENVTKSATFKGALQKLDNFVVESAFATELQRSEIMKEADNFIEKFSENVSPLIASKVYETINDEKKLGELNEDANTEVKSLFKEILGHNVKQCMLENKVTTMSEEVMDTAFAESVFDYTLLEMANTLRLVEFNNRKLNESARGFFKEESNREMRTLKESATEVQKEVVNLRRINLPSEAKKVRFSVHESAVEMELLDSHGSLIKESSEIRLCNESLAKLNPESALKEEFIGSNISKRYFDKQFVLLKNGQERRI